MSDEILQGDFQTVSEAVSETVSLAVDISISEAIDIEHDGVPELMLLEEWASFAYSHSMQTKAIDIVSPSDLDDSNLDDLAEGDVYEYADDDDRSSRHNAALVCLRITDAEEMQSLNYEFREINRPTNVLSFPMQAVDGMLFDESDLMMLGDIALCATIINDEILKLHKTAHEHWAQMVVHGILHLQGYDHEEDDDAKIMEQLETDILNQLGFSDPYQ